MPIVKNKNLKVSVIGLGKLGLPLCAALASKNFEVYGFDINPMLRKLISEKKPPFYEARLQELLNSQGKNIHILENISEAIKNSSITFIVVATPSEKNNAFSLRYVEKVINEIGLVIRNKNNYHLVVLTSTVMPLSGDEKIVPWLEKVSGKKCGKDFGFCYNPEFIALGNVIKNLLKPDFVLIGESDKKSGDILENFYRFFCSIGTKVSRMNIVNAEITKISLNSYVTMKISFANFLAELCEKTPGADVDSVTLALGNDSRIGGKYLKGGLGFGGPCFPRDNRAMAYFSEKMGVKARLALATDLINKSQIKRIVQKVTRLVSPGSKVSILGLSYKPDTTVVEESQAVMIAKSLRQSYKVSVYDPVATENCKKILGSKVRYATSLIDCVKGADAVLLTTPWKEFDESMLKFISNAIFIDCWRSFIVPKNIKCVTIGNNENSKKD